MITRSQQRLPSSFTRRRRARERQSSESNINDMGGDSAFNNKVLLELAGTIDPIDLIPDVDVLNNDFILQRTRPEEHWCWNVLYVIAAMSALILLGATINDVFMENATLTDAVEVYTLALEETKTSLFKLDEQINSLRDELEMIAMRVNQNCLEQIDRKIEKAIDKYDADKVGMVDHALESGGGSITSVRDTTPFDSQFSYTLFGIQIVQYSSNPRILIQPGTLPGQCFAFNGRSGKIRIKLSRAVEVTAFTMEHAPTSLLVEMNSAPKDFIVTGLQDEYSEIGKELGHYTYMLKGKAIQTFQAAEANIGSKTVHQYIELHILSNYGNLDFTCVYRFRVHGNTEELVQFHNQI